jgi:hypothetical protein
MTTSEAGTAGRPVGRSEAWRVGAASTAALGLILLGWALTTDFVKATGGFFADGATYYVMTYSLAEDLDLAYRREDLVRVWRDYPSGPEGIFLKRGRVVDVTESGAFPFVTVSTHEDPDTSRLYFGKAYIFPLFAAPFVWMFGTNGFLALHAVMMTLCFLCGYAVLAARSRPLPSLIFAGAFLFMSATPVYLVQIMPDFFNMALVLFAYFFWAYKEVAGPEAVARSRPLGIRWLLSPRSDVVAVVLLGIATFSKPPAHVWLLGPLLASALLRRQWRRATTMAGVFALIVVALFAFNVAVTGEWNYQGGDRRTFYSGEGGFPFQTETHGFDVVGLDRATDRVPVEVLTTREAVFDVFRRNLAYFFIGRHHGFAVYYFPGMLALLLFLLGTRDRAVWQWLTLGAALFTAVFLLLYMPFTYSGGGGPVGNRYYLGVYPLFLFLVPPLMSATSGVLATGVSALFAAPLVFNPFYAAFHPAEHVKYGVFRWLPIELTLVNDLPVNVLPTRTRQPLGGTPPVFAYFLDDNVYNREGDRFWVRGESSADVLLRAPIDIETAAEAPANRSLRISRLDVELQTGPKPNRVTISTGAETRVVDMSAGSQERFELTMPSGVPYRPDPRFPTNYIYQVRIASSTGFVPMFDSNLPDGRFLGVMVRLVPEYETTTGDTRR